MRISYKGYTIKSSTNGTYAYEILKGRDSLWDTDDLQECKDWVDSDIKIKEEELAKEAERLYQGYRNKLNRTLGSDLSDSAIDKMAEIAVADWLGISVATLNKRRANCE